MVCGNSTVPTSFFRKRDDKQNDLQLGRWLYYIHLKWEALTIAIIGCNGLRIVHIVNGAGPSFTRRVGQAAVRMDLIYMP